MEILGDTAGADAKIGIGIVREFDSHRMSILENEKQSY